MKRRYAYLIDLKKETPHFLQELVTRVFLQGSQELSSKLDKSVQGISSTRQDFEEFVKYYNNNKKKITAMCQQDLKPKLPNKPVLQEEKEGMR